MTEDSSDGADENDSSLGNLERSSNPPGEEPDSVQDAASQKDESGPDIGAHPEPEAPPTNDFNEDEIAAFFEKKGTSEILAQLADGPKQFNEINDALVVSHGTIASRLTDGAKLGLWREYITYPDDGGKVKLYELEPEAKHFAAIAKEEEIDKTTEQKRTAYEHHEDAVSNFRDRLPIDN